MRSQTVKQQEKLILLHWQLSWYIKGMMKKSRDEEGNAFQGQVRLSLHLFKQLSVSAWLAVTRLIIYSQEWRGSCRPALIIPLALDRKMHLFSSSQRSIKWGIFFFWSLVRENGMHRWKMDALFSQPNSSRVVNADGVCAVSPGEK